MTTQNEWDRVWRVVERLSEQFPEDVVLIGGVAVYLHSLQAGGLPTEYTHDADMYVALAAWSEMRDQYEVVLNRRLSKAQITIEDTEVDLYLEHNNDLRVDYDVLAMTAIDIDGVRVASLEHLLLLKLDAFAERSGSAHGKKDRRDIAKILLMLEKTEPVLVLSQLNDQDLELLERVIKSNAFMEIAEGDAQRASRLRRRSTVFVDALKEKMG